MIHKSLNKVWSFLVQKFSIKNIAPFSSRIGEIRKILVDLLILIICILSIIIVYRELKTPYVIFEPFQVPEEIEKQGLTGRAVASKLIDQIVVMRANPETTMFAPREKGATEKFKIVQNIDPKQHYLYNNWGVSLLRKGDYKEAVDKFMRAIFIDPLNPNNYIVYANWGSALLQDGKLSEADLKFRKTRELRPDIDFSDIERKSIRQLR
ncbi:hypothetical protein D3OALGA1CA_4405 [Olavius algarvensis associated proteobacterium Delta 3]|nr:hypothetical protein D3OALGA1CA_4405 [Olavius algarvensis associated proteobacterium Delta 3]